MEIQQAGVEWILEEFGLAWSEETKLKRFPSILSHSAEQFCPGL
jgi:hypothetical protein